MGRLFFSIPSTKRPSGGLKVLFEVADAFRRAGVDARMLQEGPAPVLFFAAPPMPMENPARVVFEPGDIVVASEANRSPLVDLPPFVERWIFNQNPFYSFNQPETPNVEGLGVSRILCSSRAVLDFVSQHWSALPRHLIPCAVDPALFKPKEKSLQIAMMPRKRPKLARFLAGALRRQMPDVPVVMIDTMPADAVAATLRRSAIFIALSELEGLGLPPLEAMSCGCLVVGFAGVGGEEYASPENGIWSSEDDPMSLLYDIERAIEVVREDGFAYRNYRVAARRTAARYSPEARDAAVAALVADLRLRHPGPIGVVVPQPALGAAAPR